MTSPLSINDSNLEAILRKVVSGTVSLFLGSGMNKGSNNSLGEDAPIGSELVVKIGDHFFPNEGDIIADLKSISEYVEIRESRRALDTFIYDLLSDYTPSRTLKQIPLYCWRSIYTTNFDRLLEQAYDSVGDRKQRLVPIYSDRDVQRHQIGRDVPYIKLHGCITQISSRDLPLILTMRDYENFQANRTRLFRRLQDELYDNTILFIGYSLSDPDFLALFNEVQQALGGITEFPRCYAVVLNPNRIDVEVWNARKVTLLNMTAAEFFDLAKELPSPITPVEDKATPLVEDAHLKLDINVANDLFKAFILVNSKLGYNGNPDFADFYRGNKPTWEVIRAHGDANRTLYEQIVDEVLFVEETEKASPLEVVVITAEAGGGKTSLLMRLAYDHATLFDGFCLFHKPFEDIPTSVIEELSRVLKKRIFLFVDDATDNITALANLATSARILNIPITILCGERKNEWNTVAERLTSVVPVEYEMPYLDDAEIDNILDALERNDYLCMLSDRNYEERRAIFREKAYKQMLVAMREATEGKNFDEIIKEEYESIPNDLAKRTYLHICSLHRFGVPVRETLLKRLSGIDFTEFHAQLYKPLERVVTEEVDEDLGIISYRSRHPHIAEIVCKYVMTQESSTSIYLEILDKMDIGYASDLASFRELIQTKEIIYSMPSLEHMRLFFNRALMLSGGAAFVFQHYGMMEMEHGTLEQADYCISKACQIEPKNGAYRHSYALLLVRRSRNAPNPIQAEKFFDKAQEALTDLMRWYPANSYAYATYAENLISKASQTDSTMRYEYLQEANEIVQKGLRLCIEKAYLLDVQSRILQNLGQSAEAKQALVASHQADPTRVKTALSLAALQYREQDFQGANQTVQETLSYAPTHERLNFLAARIAKALGQSSDQIINCLKRAFDPTFVDAEVNFELAVEYYRAGRHQEGEEVFEAFRKNPLYRGERRSDARRIRTYLLDQDGNKKAFEGQVSLIYGSKYGYILADLIPIQIFFHPSKELDLKTGSRVSFFVGFTYFGSNAMQIRKV